MLRNGTSTARLLLSVEENKYTKLRYVLLVVLVITLRMNLNRLYSISRKLGIGVKGRVMIMGIVVRRRVMGRVVKVMLVGEDIECLG